MKKTITIFALILVLALSIGVFAACGTVDNQKIAKTYNETDFYAFSAASVGAIIKDNTDTSAQPVQGDNTNTSAQPVQGDNTNTGAQPVQGETPDYTRLENYISMVENFLGSNSLTINEGLSDREGYQKTITAKASDFSGNAYEYTLYYNEGARVVEKDDDGEEESQSRISGILVMGDSEYAVVGEKESEGTESEISFTATVSANKYVKISQETDSNESSFEYEIYENGRLVEKFEIDLETTLKETEVELKTVKNGVTEIFEFERKKGATKDYIEITTVKNGQKEVIKAIVISNPDGTESYQFTK